MGKAASCRFRGTHEVFLNQRILTKAHGFFQRRIRKVFLPERKRKKFFIFSFTGNSNAPEERYLRNPMRSEQRERSLGKPNKIKNRTAKTASLLPNALAEQWNTFSRKTTAILCDLYKKNSVALCTQKSVPARKNPHGNTLF